MSKWYVVCTRKGWERKAYRLLIEKGVESYCPLVNLKRKWSDRVKTVSTPLFESHIFVKITEEQRPAVRLTPGVKNFVYANGRPVTMRRKDIEALQQTLADYTNIQVTQVNESNVSVNDSHQPGKKEQERAGFKTKETLIFPGKNGYLFRAKGSLCKLVSVPAANATQ